MSLSNQQQLRYGMRLAVIYAFVWFIDLLDASTLNVALPRIAEAFLIPATNAEWAIIGFLLSMTIGMSLSSWSGSNFGVRNIFLFSQVLYIASSFGCGLSSDLFQLVLFRLLQGFAGGLLIPLGLSTLMNTMPPSHWAKTASSMNLVSLLAPALGPLFAGYVTDLWGWRWLFFIKLPLSIICLLLSMAWIKKQSEKQISKFDWPGFLCSGIGLTLILWVFSEIGRSALSAISLALIFLLGLLFAVLFALIEKRARFPLIPLTLFKMPLFTFGNLIQSAANTIFLGANFIIALFLQKGLGLGIVKTGWIMSAITPGMLIIQPVIGKYYNRLGPIPFIIPGLLLLAGSMFAFIFVTPQTSLWVLASLIFIEGLASSMVQTANATSIFSDIPKNSMGAGSSLYSLFKQVSASFGVALSTMLLMVAIHFKGASAQTSTASFAVFHISFFVLGIIPLLALIFCKFIDNQKALRRVRGSDHLKTETEFGAE